MTLSGTVEGIDLLADTWERLSNWFEKQRAAITQPATVPPPPVAPPPEGPATDVASRLTAISELHAKGELTDEEFASAKARVLAGD